MIKTKDMLKWGTIAGLGGIGLYLAYRVMSKSTLEDEYRAIITAKLKGIDLYVAGKLPKKDFLMLDAVLEKRAAEIEPNLPKDIRERIIRDVFGLAGFYVAAKAANVYMENRRKGKPPQPSPPEGGIAPTPPKGTEPETTKELRWYQSMWAAVKDIPGVTKEKFGILWAWMKEHPGEIPSPAGLAAMFGISIGLAYAFYTILLADLVLPPYPF